MRLTFVVGALAVALVASSACVAALASPPASIDGARAVDDVIIVDEAPSVRGVPETSPERPVAPRRTAGSRRRPYHAAPRLVVDVVDVRGNGFTAAELQRIARDLGYWPFRRCYEEGLRRDQRLSGKVSLVVSLAMPRDVGHVIVQATTVRDESVVFCVAREAMHLAPPSRGSAATATMNIALSAGDEPIPVPPPIGHSDAVREALRQSWPGAHACYAASLARRPDLGGRLELRFRVGPGGAPIDVSESATSFPDREVAQCVLAVFEAATLPALADTASETTFVYAIHFEHRP